MPTIDQFSVDWYELQDNYAIVSSGVLWTMDYLDTLPMETALWNRTTKVTLPATLYFVGRYCMLFYAYMRISYLARGTVSDKYCADTSYPTAVALALAVLCTNVLLLLRAYAICRKNRVVLVLGMTINLARFIYGLYINLTLEVPMAGEGRPFDPRCTWIRPNNSHETLFQSVVLGLSVCLAAATFSALTGKGTDAVNSLGQIIAPFFNLVPNMIASRIFLNTHTYASADYLSFTVKGEPCEASLSTPRFAIRAMGSIGAPLQSELCGDSFDSDSTVYTGNTTVNPDSDHGADGIAEGTDVEMQAVGNIYIHVRWTLTSSN
ncbi:hypothetical protein BDY19DRAFT_909546 [Irpex rosettiformis]|uniref:Uncharacterized protein n=1 Tax=Irpex rosettiformis TaxID=378272 RepID=A0ACB8TRY5_9APHY|nr:hypothetical protein BDY19DRAFT_909546 [Irpex rosettiformis]